MHGAGQLKSDEAPPADPKPAQALREPLGLRIEVSVRALRGPADDRNAVGALGNVTLEQLLEETRLGELRHDLPTAPDLDQIVVLRGIE